MPKWNRRLLYLVGAVFVVVTSGCGRTGISTPASDASIATGGGGGDSGPAGSHGTGSQGAVPSAGSSEQAGVHSSGGISSQGGIIASAGASSLGILTSSAGGGSGGFNSLGGVTASAGNRTSSAGGGGRGGTASQGGVSSLAGMGGANSLGGSKSSGGSSGGKTATVIPPREPTSHRPKAPSCVFVRRAEPVNTTDAGVLNGNCKTHADCVTRPNGECVNVSDTGVGRYMPVYYSCIYTLCATDADCTESELCDCRDGERGTCVGRGNCRVDADCGGGPTSYCSRAYNYDCGGHHSPGSYYCHTPKDTCITDADCTGQDYCDYEVITGRWECKSPNMGCVIG